MKTVFLASVAAATLMAAPALAQDIIGSAGMTYSNTEIEGFNTDAARLDGIMAYTVAPEWTITTAANIGYGKNVTGEETVGSAAAHLTKTFSNDIRAGGFVAVSDVFGEDNFTVGAEVQKYYDQFTVTGVVAYTDAANTDLVSVGADVAYYINPSLRLNAGINHAELNTFDADIQAVSYGAGAEYQFANSPYSVSASYARTDIEGIDADTFMVGVRYNFGGTLQSLDRAGANLGRTFATFANSVF